MPSHLDALVHRAFDSMPGGSYNRFRESLGEGPEERPLFYEISLLNNSSWEYLRDRVYPSFARFLKHKSRDPETGEGFVITLFHESRCYLLEAKDFIEVYKEMEGLSSSAFHFRVLQWLSV